MDTERLNQLELRVTQLEKVVNNLCGKIEQMEKWIIPESIHPLSIDQVYDKAQSSDLNIINQNIDLPDAQKKTLIEVAKVGRKITAEEVKEITRRSLNLESSYLYKLHERGYLERQRIGRRVYYQINRKILEE